MKFDCFGNAASESSFGADLLFIGVMAERKVRDWKIPSKTVRGSGHVSVSG